MALAQYSPYSTVENSYNRFMGNSQTSPSGVPATPSGPTAGPIQYNTGAGNLRAVGDTTNINTQGNLSPQDRIQSMADKKYEQWAAQMGFQNRVNSEFDADIASALAGVKDREIYNKYTPMQPTRGSTVNNSYDRFMSNAGAAGLTGGSVTPMNQRYTQWNNNIFNQQQEIGKAINPVYQRYGRQAPSFPISTLY